MEQYFTPRPGEANPPLSTGGGISTIMKTIDPGTQQSDD